MQQAQPTIPPDPNHLPSISALLRMIFEKWYADNIPRHAAALAFYTLFAIAPLLLLSATIMGAIVGRDVAEKQLVAQVDQYIHSPETANLVQTILDNTLPSSSPWWVTAAAIIALIYGASSVFGELQIVLNLIWGAPLMLRDDLWGVVFGRLLAVLMVIASGLFLFFALVIATWSNVAQDWASNRLHAGSGYEAWSYFFVLFGLMTLVFALIYKFVPHVAIAWHDVIIGAVATAFLISIARLIITWYLSHSRMGFMFGTAGSLVIMLLWVYYSAQIFFLGAEFTYVYGRTYGARRRHQAMPQPAPPTRTEEVTVVTETTLDQGVARKADERRAAQRSADELITEEITALKPLALEPDQPVTLEVSNETPKRRRQRVRLPRPTQVAARITTWRTRVAQISAWPIKLTRPLREIVVAIGVIGALSLAALLGIPWRKRRNDETKLQ